MAIQDTPQPVTSQPVTPQPVTQPPVTQPPVTGAVESRVGERTEAPGEVQENTSPLSFEEMRMVRLARFASLTSGDSSRDVAGPSRQTFGPSRDPSVHFGNAEAQLAMEREVGQMEAMEPGQIKAREDDIGALINHQPFIIEFIID